MDKLPLVKRKGHWQSVSVEPSRFAGKKFSLRLENAPNGWSWEFGYWGDIEMIREARRAAR